MCSQRLRIQHRRDSNFVTSLLHLRSLLLCALIMAARLGGTSLLAQEAPAQPGAIPTLHVYTNLVQIPVLVLDPWRGKLSSPIAQNRFSIRIDDGPWHRPSYARLEADDPIDLSIVLDARAAPEHLVEEVDQTIADLAPSFLYPHDHVSIYAIDCSTLDFVEDVPAESGQLKRAVDTALKTWTARRQKIKAPCNQDTRLWDVLAFATDRLSTRSGRRVILAMTAGHDKKSKRSLTDLTNKAQMAGVTIFALDPSWTGRPGSLPVDDALLSNACELTGGLMLNPYLTGVPRTMQRFTQMLRERYILEFPRPTSFQAGQHGMSVKVDKLNAFIRVSGDSVPLADRVQMADASTIHPEQPIAPQTGVVSADPVPIAEDRSVPVAAVAPPPAAVVPPSPSAIAAQQPSPSGVIPTLKVATKLTVENVTVTDAQRRPVHGLERSDFTVKEDGKPQAIRDFEEYGVARPLPQTAPTQLPANTYTNAQPAPPNTSAVNILLLDNITTGLGNHLGQENVIYPKQQAINYLKRMPLGTQVAILKLENGLHLVQGVTTDREILLAAMNTISFKLVPGSSISPPSNLDQACLYANTQSRLVLDAMEQEAAYLSGIKGRKNLIWFTPGIPWLTGYSAFSRVPCLFDYTAQLHRAYGLLNAAQIALYPVDPRGLVADPLDVSSKPRMASGLALATGGLSFGGHGASDSDHDSLRDMASATGGVPFFNRNDLDGAVEEAIATGADYYSLTYVPPLPRYDGQYHMIEVKVDRPHLNLEYRPGYNSIDLMKPPESADRNSSKPMPPPTSAFDAAMGHGAAPSTQLLFDVSVTPSTAPAKPGDPIVIGTLNPLLKGKSLVRYDLLFTLSGDQIALVDGPDGTRKASVELGIAAYDAAGKVLNYLGQALKWTLKPEQVAQFTQQSLPVKMQFDLPPGKIFVRFGLRDLSSQKVGTLEIPETVTK